MHKLRWHIALLVGGSVLLMLLIFMGAFNLLMHHRIEVDADESMRLILMPDTVNISGSLVYSPETIAIFEKDGDASGSFPIYSQKDKLIMQWCENNLPGITQAAEIDGNQYYIMFTDSDFIKEMYKNEDDEENPGSIYMNGVTIQTDEDGETVESVYTSDFSGSVNELICYVDITGELEVIRKMNIVFLIAALVIGLFGSTMGYFIGRKLEQNQLAQKQFFENTSHELKTPLTSIHGYAEGIEKGVITDYPRTGRIIAAQTEKMSQLVEEILCMAKLESGTVTLDREPVDLPDFLQDCLMPYEGTVLSRGLNVTLDLHPMTVSADPGKLEHAVSNLLTNALKYAQTYIRISCGDGFIRISNDCTALSDDTLSHLFERFYTGREGNTGIGLSISRELIALHGWHIIAARTEEGICFEIRCSCSKNKL
ncbi:MAG: HAMP domain-containing histidine kinase [Oscillospiraceae bacterium]|nr:HAMP domain-containing histidine kinase [Oscillospiraceae bacterium]